MSMSEAATAAGPLDQIAVSLQVLAERLRQDPANTDRLAESEVAATLDTLKALSVPIMTAAAGDRRPVELAVRADENLILARMLFDGPDQGESRLAELQDAVFHALRAVEHLQACERVTIEVTREADRDRNDREFLSG